METLIKREESLSKAIPAIAQFVDFVRAEKTGVGNRNQLHARGCECVETGQLAARRGQGQREGLRAIAEEIAPSEDVVRVEAVVNLGDSAGEVVVRR